MERLGEQREGGREGGEGEREEMEKRRVLYISSLPLLYAK